MTTHQAKQLLQDVLSQPFDNQKESFIKLAQELLKEVDTSRAKITYVGNTVWAPFQDYITKVERLGQYRDPNDAAIDIVVVKVKDATTLDTARTRLRNVMARYLHDRIEATGEPRQAVLVAFYAEGSPSWRLSFVQTQFELEEVKGRLKPKEKHSPAKRYSYLVGQGEPVHTAQKQLLPLLTSNTPPTLEAIEKAFSVDTVTDEFFAQYKGLYNKLYAAFQEPENSKAFTSAQIDTDRFTKKLLGQIVFLYFLQKKGWLGVPKDKNFGEGDKHFVRSLFEKAKHENKNFFTHYLQYLFYEALAQDRANTPDRSYYKRFDCRIPFLNGGLFEADYDWQNTPLKLSNDLFSNEEVTSGTGILDVFDRYNFTVREDEPLEKEVAVDPEMLGKVFENMLDAQERKGKGTFYTPREIVHYMCQESLIQYLNTALNEGPAGYTTLGEAQMKLLSDQSLDKGQLSLEEPQAKQVKVPQEDIIFLVRKGSEAIEHEQQVVEQGKETDTYKALFPESIKKHAKEIDQHLKKVKICDPAIGSGAFPVGLLNEIVRVRQLLTPFLNSPADERTDYNLKRHAIQESIYGVDIDPSAIDIARLRLWLSLVVDEEDFYTIEALPNLDYKLVEGDSLPGFPDNWESKSFDEIEKLKIEFFNETNHTQKKQLKAEIEELIAQQLKLLGKKVKFDFKLFFSEVWHDRDGFDIVIGNPPYGGESIPKDIQESLCLGSRDAYGAFLSKFLGSNLPNSKRQNQTPLRPNGILALIVSDTFMTIVSHLELRRQMLSNKLLKMIRVHPDTFDATVNAAIVVAQRTTKNLGDAKHMVLMGDLTNVSARKQHDRWNEILSPTSGYVGTELTESSPEYALFRYPQSLILKNSNLPFFVASPKLFVLVQDVDVNEVEVAIDGQKIRGREVELNGKKLQLVKLSQIADVCQGLATGDNHSYLFQNPEARGTYRDINEYKQFLLTDEDLEKIRSNDELRLDVINNGISKENVNSPRYFGGRYIIPYDKGGESDASEGWMPNYYIPTNYFIDWSEWAIQRMKTWTLAEKYIEQGVPNKIRRNHEKTTVAVIRNSNLYFKNGLNFSRSGQYAPWFKINSYSVFDSEGNMIVSQLISPGILLTILASKLAKFIFKNFLNHTVHTQVTDILGFPFSVDFINISLTYSENIIKEQRQNHRYDYSNNEQLIIDKEVSNTLNLSNDLVSEIEMWYARKYPKVVQSQLEVFGNSKRNKEYEYFKKLWTY